MAIICSYLSVVFPDSQCDYRAVESDLSSVIRVRPLWHSTTLQGASPSNFPAYFVKL